MSDALNTANEATPSLSGQLDWDSLIATPARLVHPERIVACYDNVISSEVAIQLQASERVQKQLALLLMDHFELPELAQPEVFDPADVRLMASTADQISALVPMAGAVFWAQFLAAEIRTGEVGEIKRRIGDAIFQTALSNRDLAGNLPAPESLDVLETSLERDGYRCLASWHAILPSSIGAWARLKHANDKFLTPFPDGRQQALGARIMRRLATNIETSSAVEGQR